MFIRTVYTVVIFSAVVIKKKTEGIRRGRVLQMHSTDMRGGRGDLPRARIRTEKPKKKSLSFFNDTHDEKFKMDMWLN